MDPLLSRYSIVTHPQALPGQCALTGKSDEEYYIDTGVYLEFHGAVYIGASAFQEIAGLLGYADPSEVQTLKALLDLSEAARVDASKRVDALERAVDGLRDAGYSIGGVISNAGSVSTRHDVLEDAGVPEQPDEPVEDGSVGGTESVGDGEAESPESDSGEQSGQLRSTPSDSGRAKSILGI